MSTPVYDESPKYWEDYLSECRVTGKTPDISDYSVWLSEQDVDDEPWEVGENDQD